jgi:hypothetical protein
MIKPTVPRRSRWITERDIAEEKIRFENAQNGFVKELSATEEHEGDKAVFSAEQKKEILKLFTEEPSFGNKRKQELDRLLNTPVFTEVTIRFMLPEGEILESFFSPKEKVRDLREELSKVNAIYLAF